MTKSIERATGVLLRAVAFAADRHRDQRRKSVEASPYINHPVDVANTLADVGRVTNRHVLVAAVLHDTIEDTQTSAEELERLFGPKVRRLVEEVTDDKTLPRLERKRLQIEHAQDLSTGAKKIKLADKTCNLEDVVERPPVGWSLERRREYVEWTEQVVAGCRGANAALERHFDTVLRKARKVLFASH